MGKKKGPALGAPAWAGVDTHKNTHTLALLDSAGRLIGTWEFPTGAEGYAQLERQIGDTSVVVGIEGTGSYGFGLADHLQSCGYDVREVLCPKKDKRRKGKSDPIDAVAAAESVLAGKGITRKDMTGAVGDMFCLMMARDQIVAHMNAIGNCVDALLISGPDELRQEFSCYTGGARMRRLSAIRREGKREQTLKMLAARWLRAEKESDELEAEISELVRQACPALLGTPCVGALSAARLLVAAGANPERMKSEAAFSMLCGTSPIPASTGRTDRHRLNRGGDRQANRAIHDIARARMAHDPRTSVYIEGKMAEGKSKKEALRCLCRYIAREVFKLMTGPQRPLPDPITLAMRRKELGLRQVDVKDLIGLSIATLSRMENGKMLDAEVLFRYDAFLADVARSMEGGVDAR